MVRSTQHALVILLGMGLFMVPLAASADSVTVTNSVYTSASSGGNSANGSDSGANGTVTEGTSVNSVSVDTTVNGQNVEHYAATSSNPIEYAHTTNVDGVSAHVEAIANATSSPSENGATDTAPTVEVQGAASTSIEAHTVTLIRSIQASILSFMYYVFSWF